MLHPVRLILQGTVADWLVIGYLQGSSYRELMLGSPSLEVMFDWHSGLITAVTHSVATRVVTSQIQWIRDVFSAADR